MKENVIQIGGRAIGAEYPPYVIAELSGNHNGDIERAFAIMDMVKKAGADAVKLQTYTADTLTIDHDGPQFTIEGGPWDGRKLYDLYRESHTPWDWHPALFKKAESIGLTIFSSPFDSTSVDFLENLNVPAYKIASFEAADLPLIRKVASTGKPLIISTGMISSEEIWETLDAASNGDGGVALLHCVSAYPAKPEDSNLRTICELGSQYDVVAGLSDHTLGTAVAVAAVARRASIIEKHVTLKRADGGPDAAFSLEANELASLVADCRTAWEALGDVQIGRQEVSKGSVIFKRSLYVVENICKGGRLTEKNIRSIRPGNGLAPKYYDKVMGLTAKADIIRGTPLEWSLVESS